ncbi:hypothetical protein [Phycicoccus sp.]|uniref:hypothetical protein n=1 Tax=Phycicoccus sp. TaxID=1902410 RepID=UPI002C09D7D1|nr:hypothetical protein [Phycicoccus sp.]HMM94279.1 hypothetical protein [Phycicoccus sp.]
MTDAGPRVRLELRHPPEVEALAALRPPERLPAWTRGRRAVAILLVGPVLLTLLDALPTGHAPSVTGWALLAVAAGGASATLATYLPRRWPPATLRPSAPCAAGPLVLLVLAWLMAGLALSTAALVPGAVIGLGALAQRVMSASACAPRA